MRRRYITRPRAWEDYNAPTPEETVPGDALMVFETERDPFTGLLDANGNKIYAHDELCVGFLAEELS